MQQDGKPIQYEASSPDTSATSWAFSFPRTKVLTASDCIGSSRVDIMKSNRLAGPRHEDASVGERYAGEEVGPRHEDAPVGERYAGEEVRGKGSAKSHRSNLN